MLKKLVKYGNSHALILDRSILALLDIAEGAVVKLRIEGDALIIRAEKNIKPTEVLMSEIESIDEQTNALTPSSNLVMEIVRKNTHNFCKKIETDSHAMDMLKEWLPGTENQQKLEEAYEKIMRKYQDEIKVLSSEAFQKEAQNLSEKYKKNENCTKFYEELLALRSKFSPRIGEMDKEMQDITNALGYPKQLLNFN